MQAVMTKLMCNGKALSIGWVRPMDTDNGRRALANKDSRTMWTKVHLLNRNTQVPSDVGEIDGRSVNSGRVNETTCYSFDFSFSASRLFSFARFHGWVAPPLFRLGRLRLAG